MHPATRTTPALIRTLLTLAALLGLTWAPAHAVTFNLSFAGGVDVTTGSTCATALNSRCRFNSVVVGAGTGPYQRDAIITISKLTNAAINNSSVAAPNSDLDNPAPTLTGTAPAASAQDFFSPTVDVSSAGTGTGWAEFTIDFIARGAAVPAVGAGNAALPGTFHVTSFDTDAANPLREFVEYVAPATTALSSGTTLTSRAAVDGGVAYQSGTTGVSGISTDPIYKASATYTNAASVRLVYGANTGGTACSGATCERLTAFDFYVADSVVLQTDVNGFKSARLTTDADGNGAITPGDTVTYTVTYVNTGNTASTGFQITDALPSGVTTTAGAQTVRLNGTVTAAARNTAYTGTGANTTLLAAGQTLPANGTISVDIPVVVGAVTSDNTVLSNQASGSGSGATNVLSDNVDATTAFPPSVTGATGFAAPPAGSVPQTQTAAVSPTTITVRRQPTLTLNKTIAAPGRVNTNDQFTVQISSGGTTVASATTTGTNTTATTGAVTVASGTTYTLSEALAAGSGSTLSAYASTMTCTNATGGSSTTLPGGAGVSFTVTPTFGDDLTCTFTNTGTPVDLAVSQTGPATANLDGTVTYTVRVWNNGSDVTGATFTDTVPAALTNVTWTCAATGSASCGATTSGTGNTISATLGALTTDTGSAATADTNYVTFTITGTATSTGSLTNTATVTAPGGFTESSTTNNSASTSTTVTATVQCSTLYGTFGTGRELRSVTETNTVGSLIGTIPDQGTTASASATLAVYGGRFFAARDSDRTLQVLDPATGTWTQGGAFTAGATAGRLVRMAIGPDGTGYAMDGAGSFYTFSTTAPYPVTSGPRTLTITSAGAPAFGGSGDFIVDSLGRLYLLSTAANSTYVDLYELFASTSTAQYLGRITNATVINTVFGGFAATPNGIFGRSGTGRLIQVDLANLTVTQIGTDVTPGSTDLASCTYPTFTRTVTATQTVTKVAGSTGTDVRPGDTLEYTVVIRNSGNIAAGQTTFQEAIPAGTTYVPGTTTLNGTAVTDAGGAMPFTTAGSVNTPGQTAGVLSPDTTPGVLDREAVVRFRVVVGTGTTSVSAQGTTTYSDVGTQTTLTDDPGTATANDPNVTPVNQPPVANNDAASTPAGSPVTFSVTANDTDTAPGTVNAATVDLNPSTAALDTTFTVPNQGTFTVNTAGQVTFTPVAGFSGIVTRTYTVQDNQGFTSNAATITVTVTPRAVNDTASTAPSASVNVPVLNNDVGTGLQPGSVVFVNAPAGSTVTNGGKTLTNAQGTYQVQPDGSVTFTPALGFTGTTTPVSYTVTDAAGTISNPATLTITVSSITAPTATNDAASTPKGTSVTLPGATNDTPGTLPIAPATVDLDPGTAGQQTTLSVTGGTFTANANGTVTFAPAAGFAGTATATYTVADTAGNRSNAATLTVTVTNQTPTATAATNATLPASAGPTALTPGLSGTDPDGTITTFTVTTLPPAGSGTLACGGTPITTVPTSCAPGQLTFDPAATFSGNAAFQFTVTDDNGATSAPATYTIPVDAPPVAQNDVASTNPGVPVTFSVTANDTDTAPGTVDPASVVFVNPPAGSTLSPDGKTLTTPGVGTLSANADGTVTFTPAAGFTSGTLTTGYTVRDNLGQVSAPATITVSVPANTDVALSLTGPAFASPGQPVTYTLVVTNGGTNVTGTTVTVPLPAGTTFVSASAGGSVSGGTVTWTLGALAPTETRTLTLTLTAPNATFINANGVTTLTTTGTVSVAQSESTTANNTDSSSAQLVYAQLTKQVRNVTRAGPFGVTATGQPNDVLEYCIDFRNAGGAALPNFTVLDPVPTGSAALPGAYDAAAGGAGFGVQLTRGGTTSYLTSFADADNGQLDAAGLNVALGTLAVGEAGRTCFQARIP
ncbi:beta strand repeat-containing protein [Deinococcus maricopensis]|uniref:Conserved repeat domain protein n=1 Tax=Deinococcus maricopensis (strain DSM 21211 / LMG 22137 / NRRL B-23946 / LB-34) TaxID=709986 RepID=E8UBZ3_DEIML|nr:tandem-95 repeat protein [Deinococcus maricopensis]ADV68582.1 conserved repeat domain protein [Deinococcus maricopensis DSM 21211]